MLSRLEAKSLIQHHHSRGHDGVEGMLGRVRERENTGRRSTFKRSRGSLGEGGRPGKSGVSQCCIC